MNTPSKSGHMFQMVRSWSFVKLDRDHLCPSVSQNLLRFHDSFAHAPNVKQASLPLTLTKSDSLHERPHPQHYNKDLRSNGAVVRKIFPCARAPWFPFGERTNEIIRIERGEGRWSEKAEWACVNHHHRTHQALPETFSIFVVPPSISQLLINPVHKPNFFLP